MKKKVVEYFKEMVQVRFHFTLGKYFGFCGQFHLVNTSFLPLQGVKGMILYSNKLELKILENWF